MYTRVLLTSHKHAHKHTLHYIRICTQRPPRSISNTYRQTQFLLVDSTRSESGTVANYSDSKSTQCKHDVHTWRCGCRSEHGTWEAWPPIPMHASTTHNAKHAHNIIEHINHLDRYRRTRIYIYTCTYLHTYIYTYIPMQCTCTYAYIHTYIHTCTNAMYVHLCVHQSLWVSLQSSCTIVGRERNVHRDMHCLNTRVGSVWRGNYVYALARPNNMLVCVCRENRYTERHVSEADIIMYTRVQ